jgi:hypothetical protein
MYLIATEAMEIELHSNVIKHKTDLSHKILKASHPHPEGIETDSVLEQDSDLFFLWLLSVLSLKKHTF